MPTFRSAAPPPHGGPYDVIVIGDGIIGLSTTLRLGEAGQRCLVLGQARDGTASLASAGLLAPAGESLAPKVRAFFLASLGAYPAFIAELRAFDPRLAMVQGLIERTASGDLFHPRDGSVDPVRIVQALRAALEARGEATMIADPAAALSFEQDVVTVTTESGANERARNVVLAAGAWASQIAGLPRPLPVAPLKGQMIAFNARVLERPIMGDDVYLVPRDEETLAGATVERAGFDATIHATITNTLAARARALAPELAHATVARAWIGFRPATPDLLPILGRDPSDERLLYACGHSKNGILLAPATADAITDLVMHRAPASDLGPFSIARFSLSAGV
jgi:glycine/D-amino acid oxidase-like deaminating enzyme